MHRANINPKKYPHLTPNKLKVVEHLILGWKKGFVII